MRSLFRLGETPLKYVSFFEMTPCFVSYKNEIDYKFQIIEKITNFLKITSVKKIKYICLSQIEENF